MARSLMIAVLLATVATPAPALAAGGPAIAYSKVAGSAQELYLVNPDGTGTRKIYTAGRKASIGSIDLKPGGGEVAFVERSGSSTLKIIAFDAQGIPAGSPRTIAMPCAPDYIDYHPTDPILLVTAVCGSSIGVGTIGTDGSGFALEHQGPTSTSWYGQARWLQDGTYVYVRAISASSHQLCRNACEGSDLIYSSPTISRMDASRTTSTHLLIEQGTPFVSELDLSTATTNFSIAGTDGHYSPDDQRILFETPHAASGDYLHIRNADGSIFRLTGKGDYGAKDWRN